MNKEKMFNWLKKMDSYHKITLAFPSLSLPLRWGSYLAFEGLERILGEHHPHQRVLQQLKACQEDTPLFNPPQPSQKVLFFSPRGWFPSVIVQVILAKALQLRNTHCSFYVCDAGLSQCDFKPGTDPHVTKPMCLRCQSYMRRLLQATGLPFSTRKQLHHQNALERAQLIIEKLRDDELETFVYEDLPLSEWIEPSRYRSLCSRKLDGEYERKTQRGLLSSAIVMVETCQALLKQEQPDTVIVFNGLMFMDRIMMELAQKQKRKVIAFEQGWMQQSSIIWEHDRPTNPFKLDQYWKKVGTTKLTTEQHRSLQVYLQKRMKGIYQANGRWSQPKEAKETVRKELSLDPGKPVVSVFTNVTWDSALYKLEQHFAHILEWISCVLEEAAQRPGIQFVIRIHPDELKSLTHPSRDSCEAYINEVCPILPSNVQVVGPNKKLNSYALLDLSDAVLSYTSTIGLEASYYGKRVLVGANAHYGKRGFNIDVQSKKTFGQQIEEAITAPSLTDEELAFAWRYGHAFIFLHCQTFPWIQLMPRAKRKICFSKFSELEPNADILMDQLCESILQKTEWPTLRNFKEDCVSPSS